MKTVLCAVTIAIFSSAWANAQTIADIARQERAKKQAAPSKTVVDNKTLGVKPKITIDGKPAESQAATAAPTAPQTTPPAAATSSASPTAKPSVPSAAAPPADQPPPRDEKWWRSQFEDARIEVRRAENQVAVAQLELNAANRDFLTRSFDPDNRGPATVAAATKRLDDSNKNLAASRAKLSLLEEELRRAGAPAGWAR
jgi:hypothetical protein